MRSPVSLGGAGELRPVGTNRFPRPSTCCRGVPLTGDPAVPVSLGMGGTSPAHGLKRFPRLSCLLWGDPFCWCPSYPDVGCLSGERNFKRDRKGRTFPGHLLLADIPIDPLCQLCWALLTTLEGLLLDTFWFWARGKCWAGSPSSIGWRNSRRPGTVRFLLS